VGENVVASHLVSSSGSGRYQFWQAAMDAFEEKPVAGIGAGGYEAWWNQHGSIQPTVQNAHSLFLEAMAELGLVGLALIGAFFAAALLAGLTRLRSKSRDEVGVLLALLAAGLASAAIDWTWELPAVFGTVVIAAALLTGSATLPRADQEAASEPTGSAATPVRVIAGLAAAAVLVASAIALLAQLQLDSSQDVARAGDLEAAARDARAAAKIEPWAGAPMLQLALVEEEAGDVEEALRAIDDAIERDRENWKIWLVAARLNLKAGDAPAAERALAESRRLNPRSAVFVRPAPG
jgi:tetratricopeptide (TPR) repeat protein